MARGKSSRPARKMKPVILVLCEGETEAQYVESLRQKYRLPIKIVSKVVGQQISQKLINRHKKELKISGSENIDCFLMYDADVRSVVQNILQCNAKAVLSRPSIEVWFLAHEEKVPETDFSGEECISRLKQHAVWKEYRKANLSDSQKKVLWENRLVAEEHISHDVSDERVFSTVNDFIALLEKNKC